MDPVVIAVIISFFGYILYGAAGFGAAMIFHSLWTILEMFDVTSGRVDEATYYLNIMTLMVTLVMSYNNRALIQWNFVIICTIPWFGMNVIGCYLLVSSSNDLLKIILGVLLLIIFLQQTTKTIYTMITGKMLEEKLEAQSAKIEKCTSGDYSDGEEEIPFVDIRKSWYWLLFVGCGGGLLSGLFNMPGPSTIIILLFSGIHRERWKANFFTWQIPAQFFVVWFLSVKGKLYDPDMFWWYVAMSFVSIFSSKIGNFLAKYLSTTTFTFIVIALSLMGACSDISVALDDDTQQIVMSCGLIFAIFLICLLFYLLRTYVNIPYREKKYSTLHESIVLEDDETPNDENTPFEQRANKRMPRTSRG